MPTLPTLPRFMSSVLALVLAGSSAAADPTPAELLQAYEKTLGRYDRVAYRAEVQLTYDGPKLPVGTVIEDSSYQVSRDGDRCKILSSRTFHGRNQKTDKMQKTEQRGEMLWPEKGLIWVDDKPFQGERFRFGVRARFGEATATERLSMSPDGVSPVYGRFHGNGRLPLPDILRQCALSARKQQMNGQPVWVLEATGKWGSFALWLDPEADYLPRRLEQRKKGADWIEEGMPVSSVSGWKTSYYPEGRLTEDSVILEGVRIERLDTTHMLTGFTMRRSTRFDNGQTVTIATRAHIQNVRLNPDFAKENPFTITTPVPNGTRVRVLDQPNIEFEWRDGKVVKAVDQASLGNLLGHGFLSGSLWSGLLAAGSLVVLAFALTAGSRWLVRRRNLT